MPLCERLRLDAGRSFTQTLLVRVYVAMVLLIVVMVITNKQHLELDKVDFYFGKNQEMNINQFPTKSIISDTDRRLMGQMNIFTPTSGILVASNDTYCR